MTVPTRVVVEGLEPEVDGGRFATKRIVGQPSAVSATVFCDGHDEIGVELRWRHLASRSWASVAMSPVGNDRFTASFVPVELGTHEFVVRGRVDEYRTWMNAVRARVAAGLDIKVERAVGRSILTAAAERSRGRARTSLEEGAAALDGDADLGYLEALAPLVDEAVPPSEWTTSDRRLITVDRERAAFSSWYELFPRAAGFDGRPGTLRDVAKRVEYVSGLGFDVLYLPPIHPIGTTHRKGPRGRPGTADDPGSPWAIGSPAGGHTAVAPELGTIEEFDALVEAAAAREIEIALDLALQCSPDHPWVSEHPEWFRHRPDGSIACAENPPKRYEDVYPLDFGCAEWESLWRACREIVEFWIGHGVKIFRVDNPHTKPFAFWEWLIESVGREHPDVLFLAEAFTRPAVMERLAKLGFSQSYTYFAWRQSAWEIAEYHSRISSPPVSEFFRPNAWPATPDILVAPLARGPQSAFALRAVLAATLSANWGIYGPCFEQCESATRDDAEEYDRSDKYEILSYAFDPTAGVAPLVAHLNAVRRSHRALATNATLRFHECDNPQIVAYSKRANDPDAPPGGVLVIINLDPLNRQSAWVSVDPEAFGFAPGTALALADELSTGRYRWPQGRNYVALDPAFAPAHLFIVRPSAP
jgi:starch synthase (maltosyl-transferring)